MNDPAQGSEGTRPAHTAACWRRWAAVGAVSAAAVIGLVIALARWRGEAEHGSRVAAVVPMSAAPAAGTVAPAASSPADANTTWAVEALYQELLDAGRHLVAQYPDSADAASAMAEALYLRGHTEGANQWWEKTLQRNPQHFGACYGLAWNAKDQGDDRRAEEYCRQALAIAPEDLRARDLLGDILVAQGRFEEAAKMLEETAQAAPDSYRTHYLLASAYLQMREFAKAKTHAERAIDLEPTCEPALYALGTASARLGQRDEAARRFAQLRTLRESRRAETTGRPVGSGHDETSMRERTAPLHLLIGQIYYDQGDVGRAEHHWRRAASLDPENAAAHEALAVLYARQGRSAEAEAMRTVLSKLGQTGKETP